MKKNIFRLWIARGRAKRRECRENITPRVLHGSHAVHEGQNEQAAQVLKNNFLSDWPRC